MILASGDIEMNEAVFTPNPLTGLSRDVENNDNTVS